MRFLIQSCKSIVFKLTKGEGHGQPSPNKKETMRITKTKKKFNLIGIDYSITEPGICFTYGEEYECISYKTPPHTKYSHRIKRFSHYANLLIKKIPYTPSEPLKSPNTIIMMEDYAAGGQGKTNEIAEATGILKYKLYNSGFNITNNFLLCSIQHLKMFCSTSGAAKKELILKDVYKRWGFDTNNNNEADAFVLWKILKAMFDPDEKITEYQKGILKKIRIYNAPTKKKKK